jgi:integrase
VLAYRHVNVARCDGETAAIDVPNGHWNGDARDRIAAVRELMGHADLTSTSRYVHATARNTRDVVALLAGKEGETLP